MTRPRPAVRVTEANVIDLERLAHRAREAMRDGGGVAAGYTPQATNRIEDLRTAFYRLTGMVTTADAALTDWLLTEWAPGDLAAYHRLAPGARVRPFTGPRTGRTGRVVDPPRPVAAGEDDPRRAAPVLRVWVTYPDVNEPVLEPAAALEMIRS